MSAVQIHRMLKALKTSGEKGLVAEQDVNHPRRVSRYQRSEGISSRLEARAFINDLWRTVDHEIAGTAPGPAWHNKHQMTQILKVPNSAIEYLHTERAIVACFDVGPRGYLRLGSRPVEQVWYRVLDGEQVNSVQTSVEARRQWRREAPIRRGQAWVMRYVFRRTLREIAQTIGVTPGTVKHYIRSVDNGIIRQASAGPHLKSPEWHWRLWRAGAVGGDDAIDWSWRPEIPDDFKEPT